MFIFFVIANTLLAVYLIIWNYTECGLFSEADTISERDFACPAKRRKQDEHDEEVVLRRAALNDDYKYRIDLLDQPNTDVAPKR